ncbi:hypothetical protein IVB38_35335 [Bradyrhizobium sp. 38]|uniref:hypothetical protein n=1 Tax=unclassified Bradyrhizobium TaxID=2631580 RepID=UPI001FF772B1|nr:MULTISPECIES: hypothetical protein [unclassified Bradyrhizobium]MCK1341133.1 hypothetical protein [Bradyrhizobium sp. 38]MCK1777163.1 hypothetical protein [Bradyrhizobium sp. 132]
MQKLLKSVFYPLLIAALPVLHTADAKSRHHHHRPQPVTAGDPQNKPAADIRDPADKALDKKIKSICRGC